MSEIKIIVTIPAKNEAQTIKEVINRIPKYCTPLIIDDGSTDDTAEIATQNGALLEQHKTSKGVGEAFKTGINRALEEGADIIVNIDADGQMFPEDISWLIYPIIKEGADVVTATRFHFKHLPFPMPKLKRLGNKLFTKITNKITKLKLTDSQCGFRAYSRKAAAKLNLSGGYTYTQESIIDLANKNLKIVEIPIYIKAQRIGKSRVVKNVFSYGIKALTIIVQILRDNNPLKFFLIPGITLLTLSIMSGAALIIRWALGNSLFDYPWLNLLIILIFFSGFALTIFALLADMLGRQKKIQEEILYRLKNEN